MSSAKPTIPARQKTQYKNAWFAQLSLGFSSASNGTVLGDIARVGPLSVQKAFYPEGRDCAHVYLLHPPAGIVSGDELVVHIQNHPGAHSLITTPGANRFYRARDDVENKTQRQITGIQLAENAKCENFPQETIVYPGAAGVNTVDVKLHNSSVYLGWDITCLGLPSAGKAFTSGQYTQLNTVYCDDRLIYHDRIAITQENHLQHHIAGLNQHTVFATFLAYANEARVSEAQSKALVDTLRELIQQAQAEQKVSVSRVRQLIIIRYLGEQAEECKALFCKMWQVLRPLYIGKNSMQPRIWYT